MRVLALTAFLVAGLSGPAIAAPSQAVVHADWSRHFQAEGISPADGALVMYDEAQETWHRFNPERCAIPRIPASTFKIFNTMAGYEAGVLRDVSFRLPWDGQVRAIAAWNQDFDLPRAFQYSAVWFYQEIARRVGPQKMQTYLSREGYGNADMRGGLTQFWLDGRLRISPDAQIDFLRRLRHDRLAFPKEAQALTRTIMQTTTTPQGVVYGKTGLAENVEGQTVGWWVGYIDTPRGTWYYALNLTTSDAEAPVLTSRKRIMNRVLTELDLPNAN